GVPGGASWADAGWSRSRAAPGRPGAGLRTAPRLSLRPWQGTNSAGSAGPGGAAATGRGGAPTVRPPRREPFARIACHAVRAPQRAEAPEVEGPVRAPGRRAAGRRGRGLVHAARRRAGARARGGHLLQPPGRGPRPPLTPG